MTDKSAERLALEARADELGVTFAWNTGDDTLAEKIAEAEAARAGAPKYTPPIEGTAKGVGAGNDQETPAPTGVRIRVIGPKKGRWRAGRFFTREGVDLNVDDLTEAAIEAIAGDPKLEVVPYEADADD